MKKLFCLMASVVIALSFCISASAQQSDADIQETTTVTEGSSVTTEETIPDVVSLEGKTIMLVGNSMVFYGNCVISGNQGREDYGYFYQLIASNGENATVIDHTYSGKKLDYIYENYLSVIPEEERAKVDYVVVSEGNQTNEDILGTCERILSLFPETTELRFLRQPNMFDDMGLGLPCLVEGVEKLREEGYKIVDWGKLVYDIYTGVTEVPGATLDFTRSTFMKENLGYKNLAGTAVAQGQNGDRNHINPLAGYVTAQMLYSSITNRSAVFSDYSFCWDKNIHIYFDLPEFNRVHYTGEVSSNFCEVFASAQDMLGLQKLIDLYLAKEGVHPLTVQNGVNATCTSVGITQGSFCSLCGAVVKKQQIIERLGEHNLVFVDGKAETCTEDGLTDGILCSVCDEVIKPQQVIPARVHSGLTKLVRATNKKDGSITVTCKYCNEVLSSEKISAAKNISLSQSAFVYDGNMYLPEVTVKDSENKTLVENTDYTLTYASESIMPGKYGVKVTFKGNYSGSQTLNYTIAPNAVSEISATVEGADINLSWNKVTGVAGYRVYFYNSATGIYDHIASVTTGTTYKYTPAAAGTKYSFMIRSYTKNGAVVWGEYSPVFSVATKPGITDSITGSSASKTITLTWNPVFGATHYRVYKYNPSTDKYENVAYVAGVTSCKVEKLSPGKDYRFKVRAYMETDIGTYIGGLSEAFTTSTKPGVTSKIAATQTATEIKLTWKAVNGATAYRIYKYSSSKKAYVSAAYVENATSYTFTGLTTGQTYKFKVRAYRNVAAGNFIGALSSEFVTTTTPKAPTVTAKSSSKGKAVLTWADVRGESGYEVYYSLKKDSGFERYTVLESDSVKSTVSKLKSGKTYYFRVRAYRIVNDTVYYSKYKTVSVKVK